MVEPIPVSYTHLNVYLGDDRSANKVVPGFFSALHRWCENNVVESPAYIERESVTWCYGEG